MKTYPVIPCKCGRQARIVVTGVGTYVHCPYCDRHTYMCTTKEDAIRKFEEETMDQVIEYKKSYQEYKAELDAELNKTAEGFVRIGYLLKVARDTDILRESGYENVTDFAKAEYNIDKTQVSRFIHINDRFSEGGYSERLEEHYRGFGYAKLTLMLQLPDEINEEITPDYSKSEIQAIKDEVDEEKKITDIEVVLEGETQSTAIMENDLGKTIKQMGEDAPQLYADIWEAGRQQGWSIGKLQEMMAPAGQKLYSVRIRGVGRKQMLAKDKDNGDEIVLIDLRTNEKKRYAWEDVKQVWEAITAAEPETGYRGAWEATYFAEWPIKEEIAPVQQPKEEKKTVSKKESKVVKAKTGDSRQKKPDPVSQQTLHDIQEDIPEPSEAVMEEVITEPQTETEAGQQEQVEGQTSIEADFKEYMPEDAGNTGSGENTGEREDILPREKKHHDLKCLPEYFRHIEDRSKGFELRKNDRDFRVGDTVMFWEWSEETRYTGYKSRTVTISYVLQHVPQYGLADGYCIFGWND